MTNFNSLATQIGLMQGLVPGEQAWRDGGLQPFSGQTGGHAAYGWRRTETMDGARCRAVVSNYALRGCYYDSDVHPERHTGYYIGGRPEGYTPEDSYDLPGGERGYVTPDGFVAVSGPDLQHFWIDPLFDILDRATDAERVATPFGRMRAVDVARPLAVMLMDTLAGMLRRSGPYIGGGRSFARVVDSFCQGWTRGVVNAKSAAAFVDWVTEYGLPFLERAPGVVNAKGVGRFNLYQDLSWVIPACWDAEKVFVGKPELAARFKAQRERLCQWALDIDKVKGGKGAWADCRITPLIAEGVDGKPLHTLIGAIEASDVEGPEWFGDWAVRAADICRKTYPGPQAEDYFARVYEGAKGVQLGWVVAGRRRPQLARVMDDEEEVPGADEELVELLDKQWDFLHSTAAEVGYSGAYGAGKTRALCYKLVHRASQPGAVEGLCRKHLVTLKATTLRTLLEPTATQPAVLPPGTYTWNKSEKVIRIHGGGRIEYVGLDDPLKVGSYNWSGCAIDEAVELNRQDWEQVEGRLREGGEDMPRQIYWAGNPGPPSHFLAKRFGLALGEQIQPGCEVFETCTFENTFLEPDYLERMERKTGVDYQRNVLGKWVGSEGLVYDKWDRQVHVIERDVGEFVRWWIAVDDGYQNPFAALLVGMDGDGRWHVFDEVYASTLAVEDKVAEVQRLMAFAQRAGDRLWQEAIVDPAAAWLIAQFERAGIRCARKVPKDVFGGIQVVQQALVVQGDGRPRFSVSARCPNVAREFETYEWEQRHGVYTDQPKKEHDHTLDALRYLLRYREKPQPRFKA